MYPLFVYISETERGHEATKLKSLDGVIRAICDPNLRRSWTELDMLVTEYPRDIPKQTEADLPKILNGGRIPRLPETNKSIDLPEAVVLAVAAYSDCADNALYEKSSPGIDGQVSKIQSF